MKSIFGLLLISLSISAQALTLGTYNIRNFDYDQRYRISTNKPELSKMLLALNVDVLSVEEINNTNEFEKFVSTQLPGYDTELSRCGGAHGQHVGFLFNKNKVELLSFNEDLSLSNPGGPEQCNDGSRPLAIALFQVKATGQKFYGMTVHLKSGGKPADQKKRLQQYEIIKKTIAGLKATSGVQDFYIAGDFNTTEYVVRGQDYKVLTQIVKDLGMVNLADKLACSAYWWGGSDDGIESPSLLDHLIVSPGLMKISNVRAQVGGHCQKVSCREAKGQDLGISYSGLSDHCPVSAVVQ